MSHEDPALDYGWLLNDPRRSLSWFREADRTPKAAAQLRQYIYMQMAASDLVVDEEVSAKVDLPDGLLANLEEKNRLLAQLRAPIDHRIEAFLESEFADCQLELPLRLPSNTLVLDRHGLARQLSLPDGADKFESELVSSYRVANGVLHNPSQDRRTTEGTFHVAEGGLPIAADKRAVPKHVFARLFAAAFQPPPSMLLLPFTSLSAEPARTFVSLLIRPIVCPDVPGFCRHKTMEIRFIAPGSLVSNLDFVESIFGNAGDPLVPENDAALDILHWSGHTGCVILAPHLIRLKKKDLGLPHWDQATERQRTDRMCWKEPDECYNDGQAFKITFRTKAGIIITLIADNYFGYCKKEVKTQISYAANLLGNVEEEHAGGTIAFPSHSLGEEFQLDSKRYNGRSFQDLERDYGNSFIEVHPEGYGVDRQQPNIVYVNESARFSLIDQSVRWTKEGIERSLPLEPNKVYIAPSGYRIHMEKHPLAPSWRLIGTAGEGTVCHKPCTVSGGGKSEISKSLKDYMLNGPIFVADIEKDFAFLDQIFEKDYANRWANDSKEKPDYETRASRRVLDPNRSLGSVIKLLTPSREYTDSYNQWLASLPTHIYAMAFIIKRFCKPSWNGNWKEHFGVDIVNGDDGHELKYDNRKLIGDYLRIGLDQHGRWRTYKVRQDFASSTKIQLEDDITASVVVPGKFLKSLPHVDSSRSYKFVENCEYRLFQRPDDAIHRGLDKQTELDVADVGNFFCNYEPLNRSDIQQDMASVMHFEKYSPPLQNRLRTFATGEGSPEFVVSSASPRLVGGAPTKNPRYLQDRPDLTRPFARYVASRAMQVARATPAGQPLPIPVSAILSGRRNNPPDQAAGYRSLAVYNPIHYQEIPELFMDYICSLTGKSPSTTGAGSEGALTKGPFNALLPIHDLNAMLVGMTLTGLGGFSTAAGHIGPEFEVGHDISMLVPEIWCRLQPGERDPSYLIEQEFLKKVDDFEFEGRMIPASRLGYRITARFVRRYFGRVFDNPSKVFDERILCPELQDMASYADGIEYIVEAQQRVAKQYFVDSSYEFACPPLKVLLEIMAHGQWQGKDHSHPNVRKMFTRDAILGSEWYQQRLVSKQAIDIQLWQRHQAYLTEYCNRSTHKAVIERLGLKERLQKTAERLAFCHSAAYLDRIRGTLGVDPCLDHVPV
jgi:phosphoenolpyruvate carboxykinase (diphosphate)